MSIHESVQLVLQAAALSKGGEVFTLDMGEPMRIIDLATEIIRLSGQNTDEIEIRIVGPRPGEKVVEDLLDPGESPRPSPHPDIVVSRPVPPERDTLLRVVRDLRDFAARGRDEELAGRMRSLAGEGLSRVGIS
jgi:FlaA1/EpsC-like NDP-sugar epimerase